MDSISPKISPVVTLDELENALYSTSRVAARFDPFILGEQEEESYQNTTPVPKRPKLDQCNNTPKARRRLFTNR